MVNQDHDLFSQQISRYIHFFFQQLRNCQAALKKNSDELKS